MNSATVLGDPEGASGSRADGVGPIDRRGDHRALAAGRYPLNAIAVGFRDDEVSFLVFAEAVGRPEALRQEAQGSARYLVEPVAMREIDPEEGVRREAFSELEGRALSADDRT